jgi:hypothetical protein
MRNDVHGAALRAAAKVAFSVAFIGGCSAAAPDAAENDPVTGNSDGVEPGTTESDLNSKKKPKKPKVAAPAGTSCHGNPTTPQSCEAVVNAAFPTEGDYPGTKQSVSTEVQACCAELLGKSQGSLENHRWDCCANLAADAPKSLAIACTPWGPPVPPAMKRRARLLAEVA